MGPFLAGDRVVVVDEVALLMPIACLSALALRLPSLQALG